jgi:T5SS/PEP-CTERM-associated repeat protein
LQAGVLSAANGFVGRGPSGTGIATISGAGSQLVLGDSLYIGGDSLSQQGNGTVVVASGATVSASNQIKVWASGTLDLNVGNVSTALVDLQGGLISGVATIASPVSSTNGRISTAGTLILSGPVGIVTGTNLTKQGTGTLRIDGPQSHGAGATLNVAGGSVLMNSDAGTPATAAAAASANLIVRVSGSSMTLGADQELMGLNVEFGNLGTQSFNLATPATPGAFRAVRVYPADLAGTKTALYAAMRNANAVGVPDPADGIFDSGLAAHASSKLGIAQLTDVHGDGYLLIRPTRIGDLNLDGQVSISDFIDLASNFNGVNKTWQEGDLNYDGSVTISDFIDLASNFNSSYSGELFPISAGDQQALASFASSIGVAVPEPTSLAFLGLGTSLLATRRRRR